MARSKFFNKELYKSGRKKFKSHIHTPNKVSNIPKPKIKWSNASFPLNNYKVNRRVSHAQRSIKRGHKKPRKTSKPLLKICNVSDS